MRELVTPPDFVQVDRADLSVAAQVPSDGDGYTFWRFAHGDALPMSLARALKIVHIRDFTIRALMPDSVHRFAAGDAREFTTDENRRDAYALIADEDTIRTHELEHNLAGFGWFRPIRDPRETDTYEDYDFVQALGRAAATPDAYVTAAIEVFDGYRPLLKATNLIDAALRDYGEQHPELEGVCVRVGTNRAIWLVENAGFERLTKEEGGSGIFRKPLH